MAYKINLLKLGENLKNKRAERGITQSQLAQRIGTKQQRVTEWENGRHEPSLSFAFSIAKELGVTLEELLKGAVESD